MIKAVLFDLGNTLIDSGNRVFPGVEAALRLIQTFKAEDGNPLVTGLVSNFTMPVPRTDAAVAVAFADYLRILDGTGLRPFFEPVDQRVTLSTNVGVSKPAAAIFEAALKRAGVDGSLSEALFITEEAEHIDACRKLGMTALQFGVDFKKWSTAPLMIAGAIGASGNSEAVVGAALTADHGLQLQSVDSIGPNRITATARNLVKLTAPELGNLDGIHVELPVDIDARIDSEGKITAVQSRPRPDDVAEAILHVKTLTANRQLEVGASDPDSPVLPTHRLETDAQGRRILRRRRFTAW